MKRETYHLINSAVAADPERLLEAWFPSGTVRMKNFCIGSIDGDEGQSLRIRIAEPNIGMWKDFSDDSVQGKDLISLYAYKHGIQQWQAAIEVAKQFGVALPPGEADDSGRSNEVQALPPRLTAFSCQGKSQNPPRRLY